MMSITQPLASRRRDISNETSNEQLERLLDEIFQWRTKNDPNNQTFPEIWRIANEKYESQAKLNKMIIIKEDEDDKKEEEPSLFHQEKEVKLSCDAVPKNTEIVITDPVDDDEKYDETGNESDDALDLTDLTSELESITASTLKTAEKEKKVMTTMFDKKDGMNSNAESFCPHVPKTTLDPINEEQESVEGEPGDTSSITSPITQSPNSCKSSIISPTTTSSTPCTPTNISPSVTNISPSVAFPLPPLSQPLPTFPVQQFNMTLPVMSNLLTLSGLPNNNYLPILVPGLCSVPMVPPTPSVPMVTVQASSVPNNPLNQPQQPQQPQSQSVVTTPCFDDIQCEQTSIPNQFDIKQTEVTQQRNNIGDYNNNDNNTPQKPNYNQCLQNYGYETNETPQLFNDCSSNDRDYRDFTQNVIDENKRCSNFRKPTRFQPKFNNHAKGNFYISKEMIARMVRECKEKFTTNIQNDERAAFAYYKESVAMQINDGQIDDVYDTHKGLIIIINIDLHFRDGCTMYLIANENKAEFRNKVAWCIVDFMRDYEIFNEYGVEKATLPKSSRDTFPIKKAINNPPIKVPSHIINQTDFRTLPKKISKRRDNDNARRISINQRFFRKCCHESWNNGYMVPVIVIKGKKQWPEWKKFVCVYDEWGNEEWVGISLRYYSSNRQWKIECMDYDAGRIFYQHRLVGLPQNHEYNYSFNKLSGLVTTSLEIY